MQIDQKQFEDALVVASAEWPDDWFANTADDVRIFPGDGFVSKRVSFPQSELSTDVLAQMYRSVFNAFNQSVRGIGTHNSPVSDSNRIALNITDPDVAKPATCFLTSKNIWGDATHCFSLRDARTKLGFDVFSGPNGNIHVTSTWREAA